MYTNILEITNNKLYKNLYLLPGFNFAPIIIPSILDNTNKIDDDMFPDEKYMILFSKIDESQNKSSRKLHKKSRVSLKKSKKSKNNKNKTNNK